MRIQSFEVSLRAEEFRCQEVPQLLQESWNFERRTLLLGLVANDAAKATIACHTTAHVKFAFSHVRMTTMEKLIDFTCGILETYNVELIMDAITANVQTKTAKQKADLVTYCLQIRRRSRLQSMLN